MDINFEDMAYAYMRGLPTEGEYVSRFMRLPNVKKLIYEYVAQFREQSEFCAEFHCEPWVYEFLEQHDDPFRREQSRQRRIDFERFLDGMIQRNKIRKEN